MAETAEGVPDIPNNERELSIKNAKAYLLTASTKSNTNLYDHLAKVLTKVFDERPENVVDIFEDVSRKVKQETFVSAADTIRDEFEPSTEFNLAEIQKPLFDKSAEQDAEMETEEEIETPLPNVMDLGFNFEQAGIGLGREELYRIFLALKQLVDTYPLQTVRFWGKLIGTADNYIVAEVQYREGEEEEEEEEDKEEEKEEEKEDDEEEGNEEDDIPKPDYKPPVVIPKEENRSGALEEFEMPSLMDFLPFQSAESEIARRKFIVSEQKVFQTSNLRNGNLVHRCRAGDARVNTVLYVGTGVAITAFFWSQYRMQMGKKDTLL